MRGGGGLLLACKPVGCQLAHRHPGPATVRRIRLWPWRPPPWRRTAPPDAWCGTRACRSACGQGCDSARGTACRERSGTGQPQPRIDRSALLCRNVGKMWANLETGAVTVTAKTALTWVNRRPVTLAVAEGFEPSACPRSERRNGCDLRNNMVCDSPGLAWFVPKCAQNVPTGRPQHFTRVSSESPLPRRRSTDNQQ